MHLSIEKNKNQSLKLFFGPRFRKPPFGVATTALEHAENRISFNVTRLNLFVLRSFD